MQETKLFQIMISDYENLLQDGEENIISYPICS